MSGAPSGGNELEMGCVRVGADEGRGSSSEFGRDSRPVYVLALAHIAGTAEYAAFERFLPCGFAAKAT